MSLTDIEPCAELRRGEDFVCFVESGHFGFGTSFVWVGEFGGFATVVGGLLVSKKNEEKSGEDILGFLDCDSICASRNTDNFIIVFAFALLLQLWSPDQPLLDLQTKGLAPTF